MNISELKIKREFALMLKRTPSLSDVNFIIKYYKYLDDITIIQHSRFGFIIQYSIYYKDKEISLIDETKLDKKIFNKYTMNDLVLSETNKIRRQTNNVKKDIKRLKEIEY